MLPVVGVLLLTWGVLVALTEPEVHIVPWVHCVPLATPGEETSEVCRRW